MSVVAWAVSVLAVLVCGAVAMAEGHGRRRTGLDLGFVEHGGMWGDAVLLPIANAAMVPAIAGGPWLLLPLAVATAISLWLHVRWHGGAREAATDHMWPTRTHAHWARDLSLAGWLHVVYVIGELTVILAWALSPAPARAVWIVAVVLSLHVPLGLWQPGWAATGERPRRATPLLVASLLLLWMAAAAKLATAPPL